MIPTATEINLRYEEPCGDQETMKHGQITNAERTWDGKDEGREEEKYMVLRHMFTKGIMTGNERPVNGWGMETISMETYSQGPSEWRNVLNMVKSDLLTRMQAGKPANMQK